MKEKQPAKAEPATKPDPAAARGSARVKGAYFLAGAWHAADGSLLNDVEAQAAHRAMDAEVAAARAKALGGGL